MAVKNYIDISFGALFHEKKSVSSLEGWKISSGSQENLSTDSAFTLQVDSKPFSLVNNLDILDVQPEIS